MYITLATLPHLSQQQVYDHVHNHLMTQGQRSLGPEVQGFKGCASALRRVFCVTYAVVVQLVSTPPFQGGNPGSSPGYSTKHTTGEKTMNYGRQPNGVWIAWHFPDISPATRKIKNTLAPLSTTEHNIESIKRFLLGNGFTHSEDRYIDDDVVIELYMFGEQPSLSIKINHHADAQTWIKHMTKQNEFMKEIHEFAKHMPLACY